MQNDVAVICAPVGLPRYYPLLKDCCVEGEKSTTNVVGLSRFMDHDLLMLGCFHSAHPCEDYIRGRSWIPAECNRVKLSLCIPVWQLQAWKPTWKFTPTFMWNSRFSSIANICSKMSSAIRGMIPIPWGSWRLPYKKKQTRWKHASEE